MTIDECGYQDAAYCGRRWCGIELYVMYAGVIIGDVSRGELVGCENGACGVVHCC